LLDQLSHFHSCPSTRTIPIVQHASGILRVAQVLDGQLQGNNLKSACFQGDNPATMGMSKDVIDTSSIKKWIKKLREKVERAVRRIYRLQVSSCGFQGGSLPDSWSQGILFTLG
jgi:hypothetical protein